jgi:hypothetical protein
MFDALPQSNSFTLYSWVSFLDKSSSEQLIWELRDNSSQTLSLRRTFPQTLSICPFGVCQTVAKTLQEFEWTFLSVSVSEEDIRLCSNDWGRSIECSSITSAKAAFTSTTKVTVTSYNELYDLQLVLHPLNSADLSTIALSYTCHVVCDGCKGPSPTACNNFLPIVPLTTTLSGTHYDYQVGSTPFRGRTYPSVASITTTGWVKFTSPTTAPTAYFELVRLWTEE